VYLTYDGGETWHLRPLGIELEVEPGAPAYLALAGTTVAAVIGDAGPLVSRAPDQPTLRYAGLERAYALAFQGADPKAWLYLALRRTDTEPAAIALLAEDGGVLKVMDFLADDEAPLDLGPIAWDSSRGALMVGSRGGLLAMGPELPKPGRAKKAKKPVVQ
jgi:hypothetical protein